MGISSKNRKRIGFISLEGINHFLKPAFTSLLSLLVIRLSSEELWGSFVSFIVGVELILSFLNWGQKPYLLKSFSLKPHLFSKSWSVAFWARLGLMAPLTLLFLILPLSGKELFYCATWIVLKFIAQSLDPVIQYKRSYVLSIFAELGAILATVAILLSAEAINLSTLFISIIGGMALKNMLLLPVVPKGAVLKISSNELFEFLKAASPFLLLSLLGLIQVKIDLYIVTLKMDKPDIAFYQVLTGLLAILQTSAYMILGPFQKNVFRMNAKSLQKMRRKFVALGFAVVLLGSGAAFLVLKFIYLFEVDFVLIPLVMLYTLPTFWYIVKSQLLIKNEKTYFISFAAFVSTIMGAFLTYFAIQFFGIMGAMAGGILSRILFSLLISKKFAQVEAQKHAS